ncbi:MAG: hypothetical protein E7640_00670 [Ruminococcaceae bacterium]|nr:hypothetical protein [Oscillospiraceae bacterium]
MKLKKMSSVCSSFIIILVCLLCLCSVNLKAAWMYNISISEDIIIPVKVQVMPWIGVEELPHDIMGEDHEKLIDTILNGIYTDSNGKSTEIGLNNPNSYINEEILNRTQGSSWFTSDTLGSMDFWEKSDIAKYFDTATTGLSFVLYFPKNEPNVHYLFTTSIELGGSNDPNYSIGQTIYPIYRTKLVQDTETGEWEAVETKTGSCVSAYYDNPITGSWLAKYPSFDPDTWAEGKLGKTTGDAIYTYIGQTVTCYSDNDTDITYYVIKTTGNSNITVNSDNAAAKFTVSNSNGNKVDIRGGQQGTNKVVFRGTNNGTFYLAVSGGKSITFTIS